MEFWVEHNKSATYSKKLQKLFKEKLKLLKTNPYIGRKTDLGDHIRIKRISNYLIFYEIQSEIITVLTIWDSRQDPEDLEV